MPFFLHNLTTFPVHLDHCHLQTTVPAKTIVEANKQVSDVERQGLKRGKYSKHSPADKYSITGIASQTSRKFAKITLVTRRVSYRTH